MKKIKFHSIHVALILVVLWVLLSGIRMVFNFSKIVTEDFSWLSLTGVQKKEKIFGDMYTFLQIIKENTQPDQELIFYTDDDRVHYYSKYTLYPRQIEVVEVAKDPINYKIKYNNERVIIVFLAERHHQLEKHLQSRDLKLVNKYKGTGGTTGEIYKKE